jgi:hypothetical protein
MNQVSEGGKDSKAGGEKCVGGGYKKLCCPDMSLKCENKTFTGTASLRNVTSKKDHCEKYGNVIGLNCTYKSNTGFWDLSGKCVEKT